MHIRGGEDSFMKKNVLWDHIRHHQFPDLYEVSEVQPRFLPSMKSLPRMEWGGGEKCNNNPFKTWKIEGSNLHKKHLRLCGGKSRDRFVAKLEYHPSFGSKSLEFSFQRRRVALDDCFAQRWARAKHSFNSGNHTLYIGLVVEPGGRWLDLDPVVAIPTVLVLVPTILIVSLAVVLHGRKTGWSDLVCHRWRTITGISLVEICCGCLRDVFLDVISVIVAIGSRTITI
ncbi:hypothetical protein Tco_0916857 [Tanacetum coccineum]